MVALHLLREAQTGGATLAALVRRLHQFGRLVVVRPDGYIAHAVSGEAIQRAGRLHSGPDGLRAGTYEVGRFYYSDGGVFYEVGPTSNAPTLRSASQRSSTGSGRSTRCSTASKTRCGR